MSNDVTEIITIIDKSGSMSKVKQDTIGGYNEFLKSQQKLEGDANITVVLFNTTNEVLHNGVPIEEAKPLTETTYVPSGWTALYDAVGIGIDAVEARFLEVPEKDRPTNVVFAILTDGDENKSEEYKGEDGRKAILDKIAYQRETHGWEFIFLGANQDAFNNANRIGIRSCDTLNYVGSAEGTQSVYSKNLSRAISNKRLHRTVSADLGEDWKS